MTIWDVGTAISGAGTVARRGSELRVVLDTIPSYLSLTEPAPFYYRSLGQVGGTVGSAQLPPQLVQWADSVLEPLPTSADSVYWRLVNGVSGTLYQGVSVVTDIGIGCEVYRTGNQSIPNNTNTYIDFNNEMRDPFAMHDGAVSLPRIVAPVAGWYQASSCVRWAANATGVRQLSWFKNDLQYVATNSAPGNASAQTPILLVSTLVWLDKTDFICLMVFQDSGAALNAIPTTGESLWARVVRVGG